MFIPEFWCGVVSALLAEIGALLVAAIWLSHKSKK